MSSSTSTSATTLEAAESGAAPRRRRKITNLGGRFGLLVAWLIVSVVFALLRPDAFLSAANFQNIFGSQAVLLVLTIGLLFPLTVGCFDASIAGTLSLTLMLVGSLNVTHGLPIWAAVTVALVAGVVVGLLNALIVVRFGVNSFVATLGIGTLLLGLATGVSNITLTGISEALVQAARMSVFGIQASFFYGLVLTVLAWYLFRFTPVGRYMQFVGASPEVARLAGIQVGRVQVMAFVVSGFVAALAGVLLAGVLGAADPNTGTNYLMPTFAAAFLGATAIRPGRFNAWGSFIAVYFLITGISGLQIVGLSGWIEQAFYGAALVLAVSLSRISARTRA